MKLLYEASNFIDTGKMGYSIINIRREYYSLYFQRNHFSNCYLQFVLRFLRFAFGYMQVIHAYKQGDYKGVEGYVENFTPASSGEVKEEEYLRATIKKLAIKSLN